MVILGGVTVIISTYNRARYVAECIDSILAQTLPPSQILVVDDGSTDGTADVLAGFGDRIEVLSQENQGKAVALNSALPRATGEFVWIFDDDDFALRNSVAMRLELLEKRPEVDFVYTGHIYGKTGDNDGIVPGEGYCPELFEGRRLFIRLLEGCFVTQPSILARSSVYRRVGNFDERLLRGQDYDMMIRMARYCYGAGVSEPSFIVRRHDGVRGPASQAHSSQHRDRVWRSYESVIGLRLREQVHLSEYLMRSPGDGPSNSSEHRTALLQRMAVMSGKGLVDEMMDDLAAAIMLDPRAPLTVDQKRLCRSAATREFFQVAVREDTVGFIAGCRAIGGSLPASDALVALARGLLWVARNDAHRLGLMRALWLSTILMTLAVARRFEVG